MSRCARALRRPSPALAIEIVLVALLAPVMLAQLLFYAATMDPDPDGDVSYARALVIAFGLFVVAVAATNTVDGRYLLPFAPLIYLGQALGVAWIVQTLAASVQTAPAATGG